MSTLTATIWLRTRFGVSACSEREREAENTSGGRREDERCLSGMHDVLVSRLLIEHALAQQIKSCLSKHHSFQHLQPIHLALDDPLAPRQRQCRFDSKTIPQDATNKTLEFSDITGSCIIQPRCQLGQVSFSDHLQKTLDHIIKSLDLRIRRQQASEVLLLF